MRGEKLRIAVGADIGPQTTRDGKLSFYFAVPRDYDFQINGAIDVTSLEDLRLFKRFARIDYKRYREGLKTILSDSSWPALSLEEKQAIAIAHIPTREQMDEVFSLDDQDEYAMEFHTDSCDCRLERMRKAEAFVANRLEPLQIATVIATVNSSQLRHNYINFGREGTVEDYGMTGLFDYVLARAGTVYETDGIKAQTWTVRNNGDYLDCSAFADAIYEILTTGERT